MKPAMFQLVFQFDCESLEAFDAVVQIEEQLILLLGESAEVDGHDVGTKEANVFIHTVEPMEAFKKCHTFLRSKSPRVANYRAAYRSLAGSAYTVLYPEGSTNFRVA
jgi:hypothetical protein